MTPEPTDTTDATAPGAPQPRSRKDLPDWYPAWAHELADLYFSGTTCLFVVSGNVHDLLFSAGPDQDECSNLTEFLAGQLFGSWDLVLHYDLSRGLRPLAGRDSQRLQSMVRYLSGRFGEIGKWPRDPDQVLQLLDQFIERSLVEDASDQRLRIALLFGYAQYLVPAGDPVAVGRGDGARLVRFLNWAQNPYIKQANIAVCLLADKLTEINDRLVASPHVAVVEVPLPDRAARERFAKRAEASTPKSADDITPGELAELSNGLTLVNLDVLLAQAKNSRRAAGRERFRELKREMIERQCQGLIEFIEPHHTLDVVVGHEAAKQRLRDDAAAIGRGQLDTAPMGYLICGPVGTGKSFLAECYAGSIGVPCVKLRNFRSKYVGETEGNLEQVLTVLRSLGPVVVMIDEADAALGSRQAEGDSGTSARVFSMIASQMGDTRYRGKIVWMLLTSRPDLLPIDLKRQGRAEVHIPLLYPECEDEIRGMFAAMAKKNKIVLAADAIPKVATDRQLSGADVESVVLAAKRLAAVAERNQLQRADLEAALADFIPSAQGLEKERQEVAAVLECTQMTFLSPHWRAKMAQPGGRSELQERFAALGQLIDEK
ncbi:MAG: ATP-binding protein [Planctomycetia bacterium]|nr:ATP-binding protein [Planctomycetia bacterium]